MTVSTENIFKVEYGYLFDANTRHLYRVNRDRKGIVHDFEFICMINPTDNESIHDTIGYGNIPIGILRKSVDILKLKDAGKLKVIEKV